MRTEFIECKYLYQAKKAAPWACSFRKVFGGWIAFESWTDVQVWKKQK